MQPENHKLPPEGIDEYIARHAAQAEAFRQLGKSTLRCLQKMGQGFAQESAGEAGLRTVAYGDILHKSIPLSQSQTDVYVESIPVPDAYIPEERE